MRAVELPDGVEREIIVVDDGSNDGTRDVLKQLGDSTVRVVLHDVNQGKGAAVRTGFAHATGDYVLVQDADLEYDPEDWPKLLQPGAAGQGPGRLRLAVHRRAAQHAAAALDREPVPLDDHQRALQHDALRHGDVLQAARARAHRADESPVEQLRHRAGDQRQDPEARRCASTRSRSRTPAASSTKARRSPGATASPRCTRSSSTASGTDARVNRAWAAVVVNYRAGSLLTECVQSVLADTSAGDVELVVVDNGSDDGSVDVAPECGAERARDHFARQRRLRARREPRHRRDDARRSSRC